MKRFRKEHLMLLIPIGILLAIQWNNLALPYFWDEAWSYMTAINAMAKAGPTLVPGTLPQDICKGHPQFFYFLASVWKNLSGGSIPLMRLLPLMISIGVICTVYFGLFKMAGFKSAFFAALLLSVQSMFVAQSIFLLPEILTVLFFLLSFFQFQKQKYWAYAITASLMVMTKESAVILALGFGLFYLVQLLIPGKSTKLKFSHLLALLMPGLVYAIFLLLHYKAYGTFFYNDHLSYISADWTQISNKLGSAAAAIFVRYGRSVVSVFVLFSLVMLFFKREISVKPVLLMVLLFLMYLAFTVVNFYAHRYGLILLVMVVVLFAYIWGQLPFKKFVLYPVIAVLVMVCFSKTLTRKSICDTDLGYVEVIKVQQDLVEYCEKNGLHDEPMAVSFNLLFCLNDREMGYIKGDRGFSRVMDWKSLSEANYFLMESTFMETATIEKVKVEFQSIQHFKRHHAFGEIFKKPDQ
jgi:hypothetical protein